MWQFQHHFVLYLSFSPSLLKITLNELFYHTTWLQSTYSNIFFFPPFRLQSFLRARHWCTYLPLSRFFLHYINCQINPWLQLQVLLDRHQVKNWEASVFLWKEWFPSLLIIFTVRDAICFTSWVCTCLWFPYVCSLQLAGLIIFKALEVKLFWCTCTCGWVYLRKTRQKELLEASLKN